MEAIIAIANQKGGVGKSTSARTIAQGLTMRGYRALLIDLDPQRNSTLSLAADRAPHSVIDILMGSLPAKDAICSAELTDIIPGNAALASAELLFTGIGREYKLREAIAPLKELYDYIVIDTPPTLGVLTINALTAATAVLIPAEADYYSLQGLIDLKQTIDSVQKYSNPALHINGIFITRLVARSSLSRDMTTSLQAIAQQLNTKLYKSRIRLCTALAESNLMRKSIFLYAPKSNAAADYNALINEILSERNL